MRLLFLAAADSIHSYRWIKYFADRGHRIDWLSLRPLTIGEPLPNVTLHVVGASLPKPLAVLAGILRARRLLNGEGFDLVHAHYAGTYGLIGAVAAGPPFIVTAWGSDILVAGRTMMRSLVRYILRRAVAITCDAPHMVDAMAGMGISRDKIRLVLFGTDAERFRPLGKNAQLLARWNNAGQPVVISIRSLHPIYDIPTLIRAVPLVAQRVPRVQFVVAGGGPERERLEALAAETGVSALVHFCGPIVNTELPQVLSCADAYVSTSLSDAGLAASTAEAMACGVPVVITDFGDNGNWVQDGVQGFTVPLTQPAALAEKVVWLLEHPAEARAMGARGREVIETRNNYHREMAKVERLYEAALA